MVRKVRPDIIGGIRKVATATMGIVVSGVFAHPIHLRRYARLGELDYGLQPEEVQKHFVMIRSMHSNHLLRKGDISWSF